MVNFVRLPSNDRQTSRGRRGLRLRTGIITFGKSCQVLRLDLVRRVFDPDPMYKEARFGVWWWDFGVVHRGRHGSRDSGFVGNNQ